MRLLLDTHVWLWSLLEPERLSGRLRDSLREAAGEIYLSPISTWETLVLARKGRLRLELDPRSWIDRALAVSSTRMAPLTHPIAIASELLPGFPSQDPADRFLAATALVEDLVLATADQSLLGYPGVETVG